MLLSQFNMNWPCIFGLIVFVCPQSQRHDNMVVVSFACDILKRETDLHTQSQLA